MRWCPFLEGQPLEEHEQESLFHARDLATRRARFSNTAGAPLSGPSTSGPHGLPLIGTGDWNDGMNRVGIGGKGESVWLAWFLICVLQRVRRAVRSRRDEADEALPARTRRTHSRRQSKTRLGWRVVSARIFRRWHAAGLEENAGGADRFHRTILGRDLRRGRTRPGSTKPCFLRTNNSSETPSSMILLFTPPFDQSQPDPGYIKGYPPGVRENGGQYTHAASGWPWPLPGRATVTRPFMLLQHAESSRTLPRAARITSLQGEPYVVASRCLRTRGSRGRGAGPGTPVGGWMYRVWLEEVLGFRRRGDRLTIEPVIPKDWPGFRLRYRYQSTHYDIAIENPGHISHGVDLVRIGWRSRV